MEAQLAAQRQEIEVKFFEAVAEGDPDLLEQIQARVQVEEDPGQDGGAVQVAQAAAQEVAEQPAQ